MAENTPAETTALFRIVPGLGSPVEFVVPDLKLRLSSSFVEVPMEHVDKLRAAAAASGVSLEAKRKG